MPAAAARGPTVLLGRPTPTVALRAMSCSYSFGVVLWELLTWRLPWAGSGLSPYQVPPGCGAGQEGVPLQLRRPLAHGGTPAAPAG